MSEPGSLADLMQRFGVNVEYANNTVFITKEEQQPMTIDIQPMFDRVLIEKIQEDDMTSSGLYLAPSAKEKPMRGRVLYVGPGRVLDNGTMLKMSLQPGDTVLFGKHSGSMVTLYGKDLLILKEEDVFAKLLETDAAAEVKKAA